MRLLPFILSIVVIVLIYFAIVERDALRQFAGGLTESEISSTVTPAEPISDNAPVNSGAVHVIARKSSAEMIDTAVLVRGQTQAARQVELRSETSGQVISEPLRKGSTVEKGQIMCQIDMGTRDVSLAEANARLAEALARVPETEARVPESQARIEEAKSRLTEAQINLNAAEKLAEGGFASESRVANAIAAVRSAEAGVSSAEAGLKSALSGMKNVQAGIQSTEAGVASAQREIEKLTIRAPFSGLLESDTAEIGSLLQPGALCATVLNLDPIKLVGFVPEADINRIKTGVMAGARLIDGTTVSGVVSFLSRSADPSTRTFAVEIEVPNPDLKLRDGQTAEIVIAADGAPAHFLPQSALTLNNDGDLGVRVIDQDRTARFALVQVVRDTKDGIWVSGLPSEAEIVLVGQEYLIDGTPVVASYEELLQ